MKQIIYCFTPFSQIRFLTLGCHVIWNRKTTTCLREEKSQSNGQLQRLFSTKSTQLPVTCGAMAVSSTRYGVSDINLSKVTRTERQEIYSNCVLYHSHEYYTGCSKGGRRIPPTTTSRLSRGCIHTYDRLLVGTYFRCRTLLHAPPITQEPHTS